MRVLLLDDDRLALRATRRALSAAGHSVHSVESAGGAQYELQHHQAFYEVLVTDNDLGDDQSGASLSRFMRYKLAYPALVIVYTGNPEEALRDAPEGAVVIKKPNVMQVLAAIARAEETS